MKFEGIYTPLIAPFNSDFTLNFNAMASAIDFLVDAGVHGIIVAGTTGEYYAMSMKERVFLINKVKDLLNNRLPMIVGTGAIRTEDSIEYAKQAKIAGDDAIMILVQFKHLPSSWVLPHTRDSKRSVLGLLEAVLKHAEI